MSDTIALVLGTVRHNRLGIRAAQFILTKVREAGYDPILIDPMEEKLPLLDKKYEDYEEGQAPDKLEKLHSIFENATGILLIAAEYNYSPSPAMLNTLDHFWDEFKRKPFGVVSYSYGPYGGARSAEHLRSTVGGLGGVMVPGCMPIPQLHKKIDKEGNAIEEKMHTFADRFLKEFFWYVETLKAGRA